MIYDFQLIIPANTPSATPATLTCDMAPGVVERIEIQFPSGCAGLAGVAIDHRAHQAFPSNADAWFVSDGHVIGFNEQYDLTQTPFAFNLRGYNLDDTYPHTIYFRFGVTNQAKTPWSVLSRLFKIAPTPQGVV
jgi:hypothetical protein